MSLVSQWIQILELLYVKKKIAVKSLSELLHISEKTLRKNVTLLNEQISDYANIEIESGEYKLSIENMAKFQQLMNGGLKKTIDFNSSGKRISYILRCFIEGGDYITIDELAEQLEVSRGTVNNDIKKLKQKLLSFDVSIQGITNNGLKIIGSEFKIRLLMLEYVYDYYSSFYVLDEQTEQWIKLLSDHFNLDFLSQKNLKKAIAIVLHRVQENKADYYEIQYYCNFIGSNEIVKSFIAFLEEQHGVTLTTSDIGFIIFPLNMHTPNNLDMEIHSVDVEEIFAEIMEEINGRFVVDLDENTLFEAIGNHLILVMNRMVFHVKLLDIFINEIKFTYPFSYELAKVSATVLELRVQSNLNPVELSYLAIYFELILHSKKVATPQKVAIISNLGPGGTALVTRQLEAIIGKEIMIEKYSEREVLQLVYTDYLAIFTLVPIEIEHNIPIIQITNLFDTKELIQKWQDVDGKELFYHPQVDIRIQKLKDSASYIKYVKYMISTLVEQGLLDNKFMERWYVREMRQSTIFDAGIGCPHAINYQSNRIILSIGVVGAIEESEINAIFLIGIPEKLTVETEKLLIKLYDFIFRISKQKQDYQELHKITTLTDFIQYIEREE